MNTATHRFCAWTGTMFIALFLVAFVFIGRMVPPIPPSWTSVQVASFYRDHSFAIRAACAIAQLATTFGFSWSACLAIWTSKAEGKMPILAWSQLVCSAWSFGGSYMLSVTFSAAAYRADRPEQTIYELNDLGWYWMVMVGSCAVMQSVFSGIAILSDKHETPVMPRWVGYFNIWMGILLAPGVAMTFFKTGPFAWDGLFTFWMPLSAFSLWIFVNTWAVLKAIRREELAQIAGNTN